MKDLDDGLLLSLLKHDLDVAPMLSFSRMGIGQTNCFAASAPNVCIVNASHNNLKMLDILWSKICPSAWWVDASYNQISIIDIEALPFALGSLILASNSLTFEKLRVLRSTYILRLTLVGANDNSTNMMLLGINTSNYRSRVIALLPYTWVLDEKYISHSERSYFSRSTTNADDENEKNGSASTNNSEVRLQWGGRSANEREISIMRLVQSIPLDGPSSDLYRLDVLLEDYLAEAKILAASDRSRLSSKRNRGVPKCVSILRLLSIPHKIRLDLSVLLTGAILHSLPKQLFRDALAILLGSYIPNNEISCYSCLPSFVNTAIVSVIRRVCHKELQELLVMHIIPPKPTAKEFPRHTNDYLSGACHVPESCTPPAVTYIDVMGFDHLQPFKFYLERPINLRVSNSSESEREGEHFFSALELEILNTLPDAPTLSHREDLEEDEVVWHAFAARHTVMLLSAAPIFPSLTRNHHNKADQDLYDQLLPLLSAAKMRHEDLVHDISGGGRGSGRNGDGRRVSTAEKSLRFGTGIPKGKPAGLFWRDKKAKEKRKNTSVVPDHGCSYSPGSGGAWTPVELPCTDFLMKPPSFDLGSQGSELESDGEWVEETVVDSDNASVVDAADGCELTHALQQQGRASCSDDALAHDCEEDSQKPEIETGVETSTNISPHSTDRRGPSRAPQRRHQSRTFELTDMADSCLKGISNKAVFRSTEHHSEKTSLNEARVVGYSDDAALKPSFLLAPVNTAMRDVRHPSMGERDREREGRRTEEKPNSWEDIGLPPVIVGGNIPEYVDRMQITAPALRTIRTPVRLNTPTADMHRPIHTRGRDRGGERGGSELDWKDRDKGTDNEERRELLLEMGTLRNIRQLNRSFSEQFRCSRRTGQMRSAAGTDKGTGISVGSGIYGSKSSDAVTMSALIFAAAGHPDTGTGIGTRTGIGSGTRVEIGTRLGTRLGTEIGTEIGTEYARSSVKEQDSVSLIEGTDKNRLCSIDWADADDSGVFNSTSSASVRERGRDRAVPTQYMDSTDSLSDVALAPESITPGAYHPPIERAAVLNRDNATLKLKTAWYSKNNKVMFATSPINTRKNIPPLIGPGNGTSKNIPNCSHSNGHVEVERDCGSIPSNDDPVRHHSSEHFKRIHLKDNTVTPTSQCRRKTFQTPQTQIHINAKGRPKGVVSSDDVTEVPHGLSSTYIIAGDRTGTRTSRHKAATHELAANPRKQ